MAASAPVFPEENTMAKAIEFQPPMPGLRTEEERQRDLVINVGILSLIGLSVLAKIATVSIDHWRGWSPAEIVFRMPLDNWDGYMGFLSAHPILTKGLTSASVYTLGDWIGQVRTGPSRR